MGGLFMTAGEAGLLTAAAAERERLRDDAAREKLRYNAVVNSPLDSNGGSSFFNTDFNALITYANPRLRAKVRNLSRNFPPLQRIIETQIAFVTGRGGRFESQAVKRDGETADEEFRKFIEKRFRDWMRRASVDGRMSFGECQHMALRQRLETGEFFCQFAVTRRGELGLKFIEPDDVTSAGCDVYTGDGEVAVYQGIEFNARTGERLAYYVRPYSPTGLPGESLRVDARHMIHGFKMLRPYQMRGVTPFAACLIPAEDMHENYISELDRAKMGSKYLAFVETPDPGEMQQKSVIEKRMIYREPVQNAVTEYLLPGEKVTFAQSPNNLGESFNNFNKFVLRMIGNAVGVPYEISSGDYEGVNYSTSRMCRQDYNMTLELDRQWMDDSFNLPVYREWLAVEALNPANRRWAKDYFTEPWRFERAKFIAPGMPSPDPLREYKADIEAMNAGLVSPNELIAARGGDYEAVLKETAAYKELEKELGVKARPEEVSTAAANNPAKVEEQK